MKDKLAAAALIAALTVMPLASAQAHDGWGRFRGGEYDGGYGHEWGRFHDDDGDGSPFGVFPAFAGAAAALAAAPFNAIASPPVYAAPAPVYYRYPRQVVVYGYPPAYAYPTYAYPQ